MSKFLYPIKNLEIMPWIKYWLLNKGKTPSGILSEIITGESSLTLSNSVRKKFNIFNVNGNTKQQSYTGQQLFDVNELSNTSTSTIDKDGWITLNVDNTAGSSTIYTNIFTSISNLLTPSTNYLIACEIQYFNILAGTDDTNTYLCVVDSAGSSQFTTAWLLNSSNYTSKQVVIRTTKNSFSSSSTMLRTFAATKSGVKLEIKFRLSVIADTTVTEDTFVYQPFVGRNCKSKPILPTASRECIRRGRG